MILEIDHERREVSCRLDKYRNKPSEVGRVDVGDPPSVAADDVSRN